MQMENRSTWLLAYPRLSRPPPVYPARRRVQEESGNISGDDVEALALAFLVIH